MGNRYPFLPLPCFGGGFAARCFAARLCSSALPCFVTASLRNDLPRASACSFVADRARASESSDACAESVAGLAAAAEGSAARAAAAKDAAYAALASAGFCGFTGPRPILFGGGCGGDGDPSGDDDGSKAKAAQAAAKMSLPVACSAPTCSKDMAGDKEGDNEGDSEGVLDGERSFHLLVRRCSMGERG